MRHAVSESTVEEAALSWFEELGYGIANGPAIAPGEPEAEREAFDQVVLVDRLREAIERLNPEIPEEAREEAFRKVLRPESQSLVVRALDTDGKPIEHAAVAVSCGTAGGEVTRGAALTDQQGLTPTDAENGAIVLTLTKCVATDDPRQPEASAYGYRVSVEKEGFAGQTITLPAGSSLPRPLVVRLERK